MNLIEFFKRVGGDYEGAVQRLSSERLLHKFLRKFTDEPSYGALKRSLAENNAEEAFRAAHTLKGTASSLGLCRLTEAARSVTETLRGGATPSEEQIQSLDAAYRTTMEYIEKLDAE